MYMYPVFVTLQLEQPDTHASRLSLLLLLSTLLSTSSSEGLRSKVTFERVFGCLMVLGVGRGMLECLRWVGWRGVGPGRYFTRGMT